MFVLFEIVVRGKVVGTLETATAQYMLQWRDGKRTAPGCLTIAIKQVQARHPGALLRPLLKEGKS